MVELADGGAVAAVLAEPPPLDGLAGGCWWAAGQRREEFVDVLDVGIRGGLGIGDQTVAEVEELVEGDDEGRMSGVDRSQRVGSVDVGHDHVEVDGAQFAADVVHERLVLDGAADGLGGLALGEEAEHALAGGKHGACGGQGAHHAADSGGGGGCGAGGQAAAGDASGLRRLSGGGGWSGLGGAGVGAAGFKLSHGLHVGAPDLEVVEDGMVEGKHHDADVGRAVASDVADGAGWAGL